MERIVFDSGVKTYKVGSGELRFNPSDPNVYARFMEATEKLQTVEASMVEKAKAVVSQGEANGEAAIKLLQEADAEAKNILGWVFGKSNDFDKMLDGVNLLAVGGNGERVITNFIAALLPIMEEGAKKCANEQIGGAVAQAKLNRAQRRAKK